MRALKLAFENNLPRDPKVTDVLEKSWIQQSEAQFIDMVGFQGQLTVQSRSLPRDLDRTGRLRLLNLGQTGNPIIR